MRKSDDSVVMRIYVNEDADIFQFESMGKPDKQLLSLECAVIQFFKKYGLDKSDKLELFCMDFAKSIYKGIKGGENEKVD